ncbi:MAG: S-adenosylmethionine synthetase [Candidatus Tokpelaia sp. JSC189]|nr:MAG: S-adenosylmethionine synthetase [Candidatus Tokpelaia sp. JSC189]
MLHQDYFFTSESVSEGHPDKICDRISDEIVDLIYREARRTGVDPWSVRVACETLATTNRVIIAGEVRVPETLLKKDKSGNLIHDDRGNPSVNPRRFRAAARRAIKEIGYAQKGFHWKTAKIDVLLHSQSADIAQGVDNACDRQEEEGAGDQGIMFGYACRETPDLMPAPIYYAHKILETISIARHEQEGELTKLGPDAKSQITIRYRHGKPEEVASIVLSTQHIDSGWDSNKVHSIVEPYIRQALAGLKIADDCRWYINPTGKFVIGGPDGDAGLTGRKIIVDTYGGAAPHGGGAFSGKDTTKVDRSAAYAARYLAKNVVAAGLADRCTIQISYAIGVAQPLSIYVNLHKTSQVSETQVETAIRKVMDLSPSGIRRHLKLNKPIYAKTAAYGHFGRKPGRDGSFSWEKTNLVTALKTTIEELEMIKMHTGRERAFFGRRKGKPLHPHQRTLHAILLPNLRIDPEQDAPADLQTLFPIPVKAVRLEIGFGGGEHLLHEAIRFPDTGFIGVEPFVNGMAKILGQLENAPDLRKCIRLYDDDATRLLDWLPGQALDGIDLFYPDPWSKKKHWKRRFINMPNLDRFAHVLKKGALFRFVSDIDTYINWTLLHVRKHPAFEWQAQNAADWHTPYEAWPSTRYEAKAVHENRKPTYLTFLRV